MAKPLLFVFNVFCHCYMIYALIVNKCYSLLKYTDCNLICSVNIVLVIDMFSIIILYACIIVRKLCVQSCLGPGAKVLHF